MLNFVQVPKLKRCCLHCNALVPLLPVQNKQERKEGWLVWCTNDQLTFFFLQVREEDTEEKWSLVHPDNLTIWLSKKVAKREIHMKEALYGGLQKCFFSKQLLNIVQMYLNCFSWSWFNAVCTCKVCSSLYLLLHCANIIQLYLNYFWGSWLNVVGWGEAREGSETQFGQSHSI